MLEIRKTAILLEEKELLELERIMTDRDEKAISSQQNKLKCHLDAENNPVDIYKASQ